MKKIIMFLSLAFVLSVSLAVSAKPITTPKSRAEVSEMVHNNQQTIATIHDHHGALPPLLRVEPITVLALQTRFAFPPVKLRSTPPLKNLPIIGENNINCYGGTAARFARG